MCLLDKKRYRFTKEPIKVWKVCLKNSYNELSSPFQGTKIHKRMFGGIGFPRSVIYLNNGGELETEERFEGGFIHAFQTEQAAIDFTNQWSTNASFVIVEGYIPKYVRYAIGKNCDICSRILILNL